MVFLRILHLSGFSSAYIQTPTTSHLSLLLSWFLNTPERSPCSTLAPLQRTLCQTPKRFTDTYRSDWCPLSSSSPVVFLFCILLWLRAPRDSVSASSPYPALVLYSRGPRHTRPHCAFHLPGICSPQGLCPAPLHTYGHCS